VKPAFLQFCFCGLGKWGDIDTGQLICRFRSQVSELFLLTFVTDRSINSTARIKL